LNEGETLKNQILIYFISFIVLGCSTPSRSNNGGGIALQLENERVEENFHPNGKKKTEALYKKTENGKWVPDGFVRTWYPSGKPRAILKYTMGVQVGEWETFFENGLKYSLQLYDNGKPIGIWKRWYENGQLSDLSEFVQLDGRLIVKHSVYHPNGQLSEQGQWIRKIAENGEPLNVKDGKWHLYDINGQLLKVEVYIEGQLEPKS
jgi:antitoxin component YwqK of YwqJK toxin-antitoxin module